MTENPFLTVGLILPITVKFKGSNSRDWAPPSKTLSSGVVNAVLPDKEHPPSFTASGHKNASWIRVKKSLSEGHFIWNSSVDSKNYKKTVMGLPLKAAGLGFIEILAIQCQTQMRWWKLSETKRDWISPTKAAAAAPTRCSRKQAELG